MRLSYDVATDSLYIHLNDIPAADSDEVVEGVVLDYAAAGALARWSALTCNTPAQRPTLLAAA